LAGSSVAASSLTELFDPEVAQAINPDFDRGSYDFWSGFHDTIADPVVPSRSGPLSGNSALQPVFLHYGSEGFKYAAELDSGGLISEGDVSVGVNTSTLKIAPQDLETFNHLQNAQVRVDVIQANPILPAVIEQLAYTVVSGMLTMKDQLKSQPKSAPATKSAAKAPAAQSSGGKSSSGGSKGSSGSVQSINIESDASWQKMQNIILPGGVGRWALNLEAQKKDSIFFSLLQKVMTGAGQFAPMIGLPGIVMTAWESFNKIYGVIHSQPVSIIKSNQTRVFATQKAIQDTGSPSGAATGIMLKSGTYVLVPANRAPDHDAFLGSLKDLTVMQGRIVPPKTKVDQIDAAALDTLKDVTYVTFEVQTKPTRIFSGAGGRQA
jgi:hypothetical protein